MHAGTREPLLFEFISTYGNNALKIALHPLEAMLLAQHFISTAAVDKTDPTYCHSSWKKWSWCMLHWRPSPWNTTSTAYGYGRAR